MTGAQTNTPPQALIIVCDWIPPAFGAVGQYQMASAREEAARGRRVTLIGLGAATETCSEAIGMGRLQIMRLAAAKPNKRNLIARALWAFNTNFALLASLSRASAQEPGCEIKVTGSPPFLSDFVLIWAAFARRPVTYRITDFYPETAIAAGKAPWLTLLKPGFHALRRRAARIEALSACQQRRLEQSGVDGSRVVIVRDNSPVHFQPASAPAQKPFAEGLTLLYSGNLGVAHDWRTFAEAYRRHIQRGPNIVRLWLNATGAGVDPLMSYCTAHRLPIHRSEPVPLEALAGVLVAADAHLILLGERFWGYVMPSKIYACVESARPCLYIGPAESDVHALLCLDERHTSVRSGDVEGALAALNRLSESHAGARRHASAVQNET